MIKRTLIVMRHAKTEEQQLDQKDYERNLLERGKNDALSMATILKEKGFSPQVIIASSANRTIQTAEIVAQELNFDKEKLQLLQRLYLCSSRTIANVLEGLDDTVESCCIIAHNPGVSEFVFDMNRGAIDRALPTAGFVVFSFLAKSWEDLLMVKNKVELFEYPKK